MFTMQNAKDERWTDHQKFWEGYTDGAEMRRFKEYENVDGQAYDRGYEVGLNLRRSEPRHWGDDPDIGLTVGLN
ncbi:MAG: hypothetical protein WCC90_23485 [Methylocella sp.]